MTAKAPTRLAELLAGINWHEVPDGVRPDYPYPRGDVATREQLERGDAKVRLWHARAAAERHRAERQGRWAEEAGR